MILEEATKEAFGYYPNTLKPQSNKPIIAACDDCGKKRKIYKCAYRSLCRSCVQKGKFTGEKHPNFGNRGAESFNYINGFRTEDPKEYMRLYHKKYLKTINGKNAILKNNAKRRRELGYILLLPLEEGEVGHHIDNEHVIGIPKEVHAQFSGYTREKHRALVLKWLKVNDKKKYRLVFLIFKNRNM